MLAGSFRSITDSRTGGPMADVNDALAAKRAAVSHLVAAVERSAATWTTPRDASAGFPRSRSGWRIS